MGNSHSSSIYRPLTSPRETRIIRAAIKDDGNLDLCLLTIDIDQAGPRKPWYLAISYTWMDPADTVQVQVYSQQGSQHLNVTCSAVTAITDILMVCRKATLLIWIDQLSIDQFNESEKAQQIQLMKDIYENAAYVIAWIGYPSEESKIGIDKINSLLPLLPIRGMAFGSEIITDDQWDAILGDPNDADNVRCWRAAIDLMQQPYFTRGWILQEATALEETKVMVLYSRDSTTLQSCIRLYVTLLSLPPEKLQSRPLLRFLDSKRGSLGNIGLFQCIRRFDSNRTLLRLADLLRDTNITDPRDRLACVLSFSTDTNNPENPFCLTYSLSAEQIYLDYAVWDISYYKDLGILGYLAGGNGDFSSSLPSWVPDWTARPFATPFRTCAKDPERHSYIYRASGKYIDEISLRAPLPETPALLLVSGIRLGALVEPRPATRTSENGLRQTDLRCHSDGICVLNGIPLSEVYWRTSTADSTTYVDENKSVSHRRGGIDRHNPPDDVFVREMLRQMLGSRSAFLLRSKTKPESALVGIGPETICEGDEIWMLKGGAMLYVLRPKRLGEVAGGVVLNTTGGPHGGEVLDPDSLGYQVLGEAFMLGLMDGEILDMMEGGTRQPPPPLHGMDRICRPIHLI